MASYRLYLLNQAGHIVDAVELEHEDDLSAKTDAAERRSGKPAELWNLARVVAKYTSEGDTA